MNRRGWRSIRSKLLFSTLPLVLLPVLAIGSFAVGSLRSVSETSSASVDETRQALAEDVVGPSVRAASDQIAREIGFFVAERLADAETWATSPALIDAAIGASSTFEEAGLTEQTTDQLEAAYTSGSLTVQPLPADPTASFSELFFTDRRGYTVASNTRTSDFVQSDEEWWTSAWERGIHISEVDLDESANAMSVDISMRLDDAGGRPVGVMKAVLPVANVQDIADRFAGGSTGYQIIVTDQRGFLLAETESAHDPQRIVSEEVTARNSDNPRLNRALSMAGNIYSIDDEKVAGFSQINRVIATGADLATDATARSLKLSFDWRVVVEQPVQIAFAPLDTLGVIEQDINDTSGSLSLTLLAVAIGAGIVALTIIWLVAQRITRPIEQLSTSASTVASDTLPDIVQAIEAAGEDDELPELEDIEVHTGDEVESLAIAFNAMQHTATRLAAEQAHLRRSNVAKTFVSLGRRNQSLLTRQLELLDGMEREEADPDSLSQLFRLDHLATRMRRNAESLLILAGEDVPRRFRRPVAVHDVIQAAGAEIEDFTRIEIIRVDDASVDGTAASAVAHLLAELLENSSRYSPPTSRIQIDGRRRDEGFTISVVDQGIGMTDEELANANARLADPAEFDRAPSAYLGLFVVGHLARRHGIEVRLNHSPFDGVAARVDIPETLLAGEKDRRPADNHDDVILDDRTVESSPFEAPVAPLIDEPQPSTREPASPFARDASSPFEGATQVDVPSSSPTPVPPALAGAPNERVAEAPSEMPVADPTSDRTGEAPQVTPSGFRRRRRGQEGAPSNAVTTTSSPKVRDAKEVGDFLSSFRSGVNRGRVEVWEGPEIESRDLTKSTDDPGAGAGETRGES